VLLAKGLQLSDLSAGFLSMFTQLSNLIYVLVEISDQSTGQLHLLGKASNAVMTFYGQHHSFSSFTGSAQEVAILHMLHLIIHLMMQCDQSFSCSISHSSLKRPPQGGSLDHLADTMDTIDHRLLIYDHLYVLEIHVLSKQPWSSNEEWGIAIT
jgi:hypothetical protein